MLRNQTTLGKPDFLKRHPLISSVLLLFLLETIGHVLWLRGYLPDNNAGGKILYGVLPVMWFVATVILICRKFL